MLKCCCHFVQIYVVDSMDRDRIGVAREEFQAIIKDPLMLNSVILVLANKQDQVPNRPPSTFWEPVIWPEFGLENPKWGTEISLVHTEYISCFTTWDSIPSSSNNNKSSQAF
jgi:hypothetical protein